MYIYLLPIAVLLCLSLLIRIILLGFDLPYYSIDENDIVEPALAFVAGDWDPRWYKYGPLFSYTLATIFTIEKWFLVTFSQWTDSDFFYAAFFDPSTFYYQARLLHLIIVGLITAVAARFCWRYYGKNELLIILVLSIAPLFETITNYTARVDTLQGLLALLCLYHATKFNAHERYYLSYILAGIFFGLSFATKPLTALLLLPAVLLGHILTTQRSAPVAWRLTIKNLAVDNKGIYVFILASFLVHSIVHPFSLINFDAFWQELYSTVFSQAKQNGTIPGYDLSWLFDKWGILLALLAFLAPIVLLVKKDRISYVLIAYVFTFLSAFILFKTRIYWYNSMLPVLLVISARLLFLGGNILIQKYGVLSQYSRLFYSVLALLLVISPLNTARAFIFNNSPLVRADMAAQEWVEKHLPSGSKIVVVGWYAGSLPRLRANQHKLNAQWMECMMYRRNENSGWVNRYIEAYQRFSQTSSPSYDLLNIKKDYHANHDEEIISGVSVNDLLENKLHLLARQSGSQYIITASYTNFSGNWETSNNVRMLAKFNSDNGHRGVEVKVFAVDT